MLAGAAVKTVLNIILVSNPTINIYGSPISSIICQLINFTICYIYLNRYIKMNITFKKNILKPLISAVIMGISVYYLHMFLEGIIGNSIATVVSIIAGVGIYGLLIIVTKTLTKQDMLMIPFGTKLYSVLVKYKIYKEERT